ncbi:Gpi1-domain-containing protein, partial [Fistulina hepatica ATCC 64428]
QQFDVRVEQFEFFLVQTRLLRARNASPVHVYARQYTEFFNTVWLLLNDITIGVAVGSFLCDNHVVLSHILDEFFQKVFVQWIEWVLFWLDAWPAGLKLNTELSHFYSRLFAYLIRHWGDMVEFVFRMHLPLIDAPFLPAVIYALGLASCCGVTITISICADMLSFVTAHLYLCYIVTSVVYHRMLETAGSLWNLFRGKRFNVLRNRTDTWEYDIDQLLFGTIVFTLLAFLFPTVLAYYSLFALMRLSVIVTLASLDTLLAFMNHFPLFALMLRIKDPKRIPGNQPVPMSSIFSQYILLSSHLASHYNPLRLLRNVLRGDLLTAIPRVLIRFSKGKGVL